MLLARKPEAGVNMHYRNSEGQDYEQILKFIVTLGMLLSM